MPYPTLPIILSPGYIAVYGNGGLGYTQQLIQPISNQRYGTVYHVWDGGRPYVYGGTQVIFNEQDVYCRLAASDGNTYTVLPYSRIVTQNILT